MVDDFLLLWFCIECLVIIKLLFVIFLLYVNEVICGDDDGNCFGFIGKCV